MCSLTAATAFVPLCPAITAETTKLAAVDSDAPSRRAFLTTSIALISGPTVVNARYGDDAKMLIPDVVQGMADRTNKQCLVESLGNRECLVYIDPENQLYKGSDGKLLFERLAQSVDALKHIPDYVGKKQWSNVESTLTGKMGNLSFTMNEFGKLSEDDYVKEKIKALSVEVRNELYSIQGGCSRKSQSEAMKSYDKAVLKLEKFVALVNGM